MNDIPKSFPPSKKQCPINILRGILTCLFIHITAVILLSSVPPTSRDALTHHLFIPKLFTLYGGIYEIPEVSFSYYPMNLDLLYMIPLYLGNDIFPKYIHFFFALFTAWLIYSYLRTKINTVAGAFGGLFFLSVPVIIKLSITAYIDLGLIFFSTASLLLIFKWVEKNHTFKYLILASLLCGLAAGTKYNGLLTIFILTAFVPIIYIRSSSTRHAGLKGLVWGGLFLLGAIITVSPWLIKNYQWTGNPVYPLHNSFFNETTTNNPKEEQEDISEISTNTSKTFAPRPYSILALRKAYFKETGIQILFLPIRFFFEGRDDDPRYFDGKLSPFLLILPVFAFVYNREKKQVKLQQYFLLAYATLFFFLAFFQTALRIRYVSPIIPPLVILSVYGLKNIHLFLSQLDNLTRKRISSIILAIIAVTVLSYNAVYLTKQFAKVQPFTYLMGQVTRKQYIAHFRPEYPLIQLLNTSPDKNQKTLAIFIGNRGYYFDQPVQFDLQNNQSTFCTIIRDSSTAAEIADKLHNIGITHLMIRYTIFNDWIKHRLTLDETHLLQKFLQKKTTLVSENNEYGLIYLLPAIKAALQKNETF